MLSLEHLSSGLNVEGLDPACIVTIAAVVPLGPDARTLYYKLPDGSLRERLVGRADEALLSIAKAERPWAFDGTPELFQLVVEARRIELAHLFDPMMAVHTSNVDPLPHQITAVYESMLPRQPLRFILADDPGAGKTIMAGLYIRELIMRADARRVLIVTPGSLVEQWRDELLEKFGLEFSVYSQALELSTASGNPFEDRDQLIVRLDQLARRDELQEKVCAPGWDLVIFDEAHKLSAHFFGNEVKRTRRFHLAEKLGASTRHLLLMTATPHNGKEEDFQLFLSLLDSDRFYGKFRDGVHKADVSDLMRRMVKEELVKFDNTPLFPERRAYTVNYSLSPLEAHLYELVTNYVKHEMGKAELLEGKRRASVGFALTTLQRRLASSPEAIFQSLKRRSERLSKKLEQLRHAGRSQPLAEVLAAPVTELPDDDDDLDAQEQEVLEEALVDDASAATSLTELEGEILVLKGLVLHAQKVVGSGQDRKWEELSRLLQDDEEIRDHEGRLRKLIIFTEHRDTLNYLHARISGLMGGTDAIVTIHGGTPRDARRLAQTAFREDPAIRVLIATDAAGEGVNLQKANLMVNYDLPWNPNRLEQRFGRIHRIGQTEVCHLWNMVASETREGQVYHRLLEKLRVEAQALKGRVFDILGEVFEETSLKTLLMEAIRYGDQPEVRARLYQQVESALDTAHLKALLERNALAQENMSPERLFDVKEEMEKAEARRLQPYFIRAFFLQAFQHLGGSMHAREAERFEITWVPTAIRERGRLLSGKNRRDNSPVVKRYERVCFSRDAIRPAGRSQLTAASLIHPGHPLMRAMTDVIVGTHSNLLKQGTVLLDPTDESDQPWLLFLLNHQITSGDGEVISRRLQFVRVNPDGTSAFAGWAPHLDLVPLPTDDRDRIDPLLDQPWVRADLEQRAIALAASTLVPSHYEEVASRRIAQVDKTLQAVHERLNREIDYWTERHLKYKEELAAGKDVSRFIENSRRTLADLEARLATRSHELKAMRHVASATPVALGAALVIPQGLLTALRGEASATNFSRDAKARSRIEALAMKAVRKAEETRGYTVKDVSADKCGWDLTSYPPSEEGRLLSSRHIEVKGRIKGASTITLTRNEILYALNQSDKFWLAIVLVDEQERLEGPFYLRNPFTVEPDWNVASVNVELKALLERAETLS